jgi:hypothetical protein
MVHSVFLMRPKVLFQGALQSKQILPGCQLQRRLLELTSFAHLLIASQMH